MMMMDHSVYYSNRKTSSLKARLSISPSSPFSLKVYLEWLLCTPTLAFATKSVKQPKRRNGWINWWKPLEWWRWWSIRRLLPWQTRRPCASFKVAGAVADGLQGPWLRYYVAVSTRAWLVIECDCFSLSFTSLFFFALYVAETASLLCRFLL